MEPSAPNGTSLRALTPDDWSIFRSLRLQALRETPGAYFSSHESEAKLSEAAWKERLDGNRKCIFGLFDGGNDLIGIAAIFTWRDDPTAQTGILAMDYVDARYRGRGLSRLLYQGRITWAIGQPHLTRLVISHRAGNEASRRAMLSSGFEYRGKRTIHWPDGVDAEEWNYGLDLEALRRAKHN
jgi:RimJ/RimL family protein N-acetyltransferase